MATIPNPELRRARKTVAFDGGANNGANGDYVPLFTLTGRVFLERLTIFCTETLVNASGGAQLGFLTTTEEYQIAGNLDMFGAGAVEAGEFIFNETRYPDAAPPANWTVDGDYGRPRDNALAIASSLQMLVEGDQVTDGTLVFDVWYYPITDDGALTGDDADLSYPAKVRGAVGMASANLDTQLGDLPTNAELATALAAADDAVLAAIAALENLSAAEVNAEVLDVLNVDTFALPGQGAPSATPTVIAALLYLFKHWRNELVVDRVTGEHRLYNDAVDTIDQEWTVTDDGDELTKTEVGSGA